MNSAQIPASIYRKSSMYNISNKPNRLFYLLMLCLIIYAIAGPKIATAADDKSIKGQLRNDIHNSMEQYINKQTIDGKLYVFDAVQNKLLTLTSGKLRHGIVKDGGFFLTCADFTDQNGNKIDLDFMVKSSGKTFITTQTIVHAVEGEYRPYHLRDRNN